MRGQKGGSWKTTGCSSPLGAYVDNTRGQGRANAAVTGTIAYAGKQGLSGGDETWTALTTMILPVAGVPFVVPPKRPNDYDAATPVIQDLMDKGTRFVAVSGLGLLAPGDTGQMNDGGPSAARTAIAYARRRTRCTSSRAAATPPTSSRICSAGSAATPRSCSTAADRRRSCCDARPAACGRARVYQGSCDTYQVLCDSRERALPSWLAFN